MEPQARPLATEPPADAGESRPARAGWRARRLGIAGLSIVGLPVSLYMLAYQGGWIKTLACPFFGKGCERVGRSAHAEHLGVPNAAVGAVGYAALAALALGAGQAPLEQRRGPSLLLGAIALGAAGASAVLTWEQKVKVRAWCFWCLLTAGINAAILPLALVEAGRALRRR